MRGMTENSKETVKILGGVVAGFLVLFAVFVGWPQYQAQQESDERVRQLTEAFLN